MEQNLKQPEFDDKPDPAADPVRARLVDRALHTSDSSVGSKASIAARVLFGWLVFVVAAEVAAFAPTTATPAQRLAAALVSGAVFLVAFRSERRGATFARLSSLALMVYRIRAVIVGATMLGSIAFFLPAIGITISGIIQTALVLLVVGSLWSMLTRQLLGARAIRRVVIVGEGEQVDRLLTDFARDPHPDFTIVGTISETDVGAGGGVLGSVDELEFLLTESRVDTVVLAAKRDRLALFGRLSSYTGRDITVQELPAFSEHAFGRVPVDTINAAWFMHMIHPFYQPYSRLAKRLADLIAASAIALVALPLIPFVALMVKLTSRGPALYSQVRVGEHGREFRIYKFRTMSVDAEKDGAQWAAKSDPRVTPVGGFMRSTRLDELPQLWNIIRGHMSFVGPRPERPEFVTDLERSIPYYRRRHMVKPGLTGWAQVRLGYSDSIDGAADKLGFELYYLKHRSLMLDFVIFVETIRVVLLRFGAR